MISHCCMYVSKQLSSWNRKSKLSTTTGVSGHIFNLEEIIIKLKKLIARPTAMQACAITTAHKVPNRGKNSVLVQHMTT